ncbi:uncharacterized protein LOC122262148 [Penaeus japonicus]|uniref:uncharacterized protein LOC122262148 n=1 Tax=Penaeus japonicus TaxID=27405 RepID=UPI001C710B08|nr:uncharacterized protein LOC122262148 [Penaeus japonicus]
MIGSFFIGEFPTHVASRASATSLLFPGRPERLNTPGFRCGEWRALGRKNLQADSHHLNEPPLLMQLLLILCFQQAVCERAGRPQAQRVTISASPAPSREEGDALRGRSYHKANRRSCTSSCSHDYVFLKHHLHLHCHIHIHHLFHLHL